MPTTIAPTGIPDADRALGFDADTWDHAEFVAKGNLTLAARMPSAVLAPPAARHALPPGPPLALERLRLKDPLFERPVDAATFLDRRLYNDGLLVFQRGGVRHESYRNGFRPRDLHIAQSCSKTLTTMMAGIAFAEGRLAPDDPIAHRVPALAPIRAWDGVTLQHVLDMATGIACDEDYENPAGMYRRYARAVGYYAGTQEERVGCIEFARRELTRRACEPGTVFNYASYNTNLIAAALQSAYGCPAADLYERHLYARIGAESPCQLNLDPKGAPLVEGHLNLTLRDFARWALLYLNGGRNLARETVVPEAFVEDTIAPDARRAQAFARGEAAAAFPGAQYHNQTWVLDPAGRRFAMLGIHGQFAYLDLPRELLVVGFGSYPVPLSPLMIECLKRLWAAISESA